MGQKANPVAVRLSASTRRFAQQWYSGVFYQKLIEKDLLLTKYLTPVFKLFKLPQTHLAVAHFPKTTRVSNFFCYPKSFRELTGKLFGITSHLGKVNTNTSPRRESIKKASLAGSSIQNDALFSAQSLSKNHTSEQDRPSSFYTFSILKANQAKNKSHLSGLGLAVSEKSFVNPFKIRELVNSNSGIIDQLSSPLQKKSIQPHDIHDLFQWYLATSYTSSFNQLANHQQKNTQSLGGKYSSHFERILSKTNPCPVDLINFQADYEWQSAQYFVDEIVGLLERRISFRSLKNRVFKQISKNPAIQGFRITCSGRAGGKSKKSQRAKVESLIYGEPSLHVFSSKIDYASGAALTPLGLVGIQVWIRYTQKV